MWEGQPSVQPVKVTKKQVEESEGKPSSQIPEDVGAILFEETGEGINLRKEQGQTPYDFALTKEPLVDDAFDLQREVSEQRIEEDREAELQHYRELEGARVEKDIDKGFQNQLKKRQFKGRLREVSREEHGGGLPL
jgi:hypothetical protein